MDPKLFCLDHAFRFPDPDPTLKRGKINNKLLVNNGTAARFVKHFKDLRKYSIYLIKDKLDHL